MHYAIRHITRFAYDAPIRESVMEIRMQPRTELVQRCLRFELSTQPRAHVSSYVDPMGNMVHHFDIPAEHTGLTITAESIVEFIADAPDPTPFDGDAWAEVDRLAAAADGWEMVLPSEFARDTPMLIDFAGTLGIGRDRDPLAAVLALSEVVYRTFEYRPQSTRVDSPIDDALTSRQGVCQDFAHVLIALVRRLGIPCRYVSGYLFHARGERTAEGATHAWVEALLPGNGWIGVDPTSNVLAGPRHVRVAVGRDYADVAPTRGVYKGVAAGTLAVAVHVSRDDLPPVSMRYSPTLTWTAPAAAPPRIQGQEEQQQQ